MATVTIDDPKTAKDKVIKVKNLGWLLRHASECNRIFIVRHGESQALSAGGELPDGRTWYYYVTFADFGVARKWIKRPSLSHLTHIYLDNAYEFSAVTEQHHIECYG